MENRKGAILFALALTLASVQTAIARDGGGGGGRGDRGGYPIGTESSSQYSSALSAKSDMDGRMFSHGGNRSWWGGGGGAYGGYGGYGYGGVGGAMPFTPNSGGYPLPDGVAAYNPIPVAPSEAALPTEDLHQSGPSMSFQSDLPPSNTSFQDDSWVNSIPDGDIVSNVGRNFKVPAVQRGITAPLRKNGQRQLASGSGSANGGGQSLAAYELTKPVTDALASVQQVFMDAKSTGALGTFDIEEYQKRLDALNDSVKTFLQAPLSHGEDESGDLTNSINKLGDDIRLHNGGNN